MKQRRETQQSENKARRQEIRSQIKTDNGNET